MVLSVIIVNYRVRYFLELCLYSVSKALADIEAEIIVVDNHSGDGSVEALKPLFPAVQFIVNQVNTGFAAANNEALRQACGEFILFLNPDTLLPEDYARICLDFLRDRPNAGGLGVRMIDGGGQFLKESRRGFPSPWVAFCKMSGLSALFPRSRLFAGYYLGHLPEDSSHPAPVLSGACLLVRRKVLDTVGSFDERFFMYAEDIDLSYRMEKAGYQNYYTSGTTVIHFKGESTRKDSRYIRQFYKAMSQFRRKHFNRGLPAVFNGTMEAAIWMRAGIAGLARSFSRPFRRRGSHAGTEAVETAATSGTRFTGGRSETVGRRSQSAALPACWLTGDPVETARVREILIASGKCALAGSPETAKELLFCQGNDFSFRDCIAGLEAASPCRHGQEAKFVAAGSNSATGSTHRDGQGETLLF
jgi:N-acetylglucosaminyl-diphospho-decaprenol L-rhamnosyltransferase